MHVWVVKSRPDIRMVQEQSPENYPEGQTIQPGKPTMMTKEEYHFGLGRTEWMTGVRNQE